MVSSKSDWLIKSNPEDRSLCPYGRRGGWLGRFRLWRACLDTRLGSGSGLVVEHCSDGPIPLYGFL